MKTDEQKHPTPIHEQAAEWFARMQDPHSTVEERQAFLRWLRQSREHITEYLRAAVLEAYLSEAADYALSKDVLIREARSEIVEPRTYERRGTKNDQEAQRSSWHWRVAAAMAAFALSALLAIATKVVWFDPVIETEIGQWREQTLGDGTVVRSGPNTHLSLDFADGVRLVQLARGEAEFDVASDPRRPFAVRAGMVDARATGTRFGVAVRDEQVVVTVADGSVLVSRGALAARDAALRSPPQNSVGLEMVTLRAGEELRITPSGALVARAVDASKELAWARQELIFLSGTTLADASREFNIRNRIQIAIDDPALASREIRGIFDAGDPSAFAATIARTGNMSVRAERGTLHINSRTGADER